MAACCLCFNFEDFKNDTLFMKQASGNRCLAVVKCNLIKIQETAAATNKNQKDSFSLKKYIKSAGRHSSLKRVWCAPL